MESVTAPSRLRALPSWLLSQAGLPAQRLVSEGLGSIDGHRYHFSVLSALDEFGPASQAELCRRSGIDRSDMVALLNELASARMVTRAPDPGDGRRNVITISAAGRQRLAELDRVLADVQERILAPLSAGEREQLVRTLTRIVDHHTGA